MIATPDPTPREGEQEPPPWQELLTLDDFEQAARHVLSNPVYEYFRCGAGAERTLAANRSAFDAWSIYYRVLQDVSHVDLRTTVLGTPLPHPLLVAPTAYHGLAHPDGEVATARGAAEAGALYVASTLSSVPMEEIAAAGAAPGWFQLYVHKDRGLTRSLVQRAAAAGYRALVLTVDTPVLGRRISCERSGFALPPWLRLANLTEAGDVPVGSVPLWHVAARHDPAMTWKDVEWLRGLSDLPLVIKGIVRRDDALRAVACGARAIVVSNHGGRQLDGAPAPLEALPAIVEGTAGQCEVLMDGGVRYGSDALIALCLGARAVLIGRPVLWGLALGGAAGVTRVIEILRDDLARAMALCGCPALSDLGADLVQRRRDG